MRSHKPIVTKSDHGYNSAAEAQARGRAWYEAVTAPDVQIPMWICLRADLPPLSKLLYGCIVARPGATCRDCARMTGTPVEDTIRALNALRAAGIEVPDSAGLSTPIAEVSR